MAGIKDTTKRATAGWTRSRYYQGDVELNILFLGPKDSRVYKYLLDTELSVFQTEENFFPLFGMDCMISHGYRHIVPEYVLNAYKNRIINLHISYLPWNKGADPNYWSHYSRTPKGVTIHYMDKGLDTGDIIAQRQVIFCYETDTLASTYAHLQYEMLKLFKEQWPLIKVGANSRTPQQGEGSYHRHKEILGARLTAGWHTKLSDIHN